jgi:cleavage and polyadenylation specificity factor subunit 1
MPNIADLIASIGKARVFSKLDLLKGYFQVPVHPDDVPKTAIITPFGSFVFHFSTFGLRNSGATFQRLMDRLLGHLPFCAVYVDDILIFSDDDTAHHRHLDQVLAILEKNGLVARQDKCVFGNTSVEFLGYSISADGIRPLQSRVHAIDNFPRPTTVKGVQEFLGMINYYHRFIPHAAATLAPLYDAVSGKRKTLQWTVANDTAFTNAATLAFPNPRANLILSTDASNVAIGAVLEQVLEGTRQPLAFFSRRLLPAQRNYSTFDRELLAAHQAIRHFRYILDGASFTIQTDHKPLVTALLKPGDAWTARQQRHLSAIAETGCIMEYIPGANNPVADALSRIEIASVQIGVDYSALADEQSRDPETNAYRTAITNLKWKHVQFGDTPVLCDVSSGRPRPLIPAKFRRQIFELVHGLAHPSIRSTTKLMTDKFIWHSIKKDVSAWSRTCEPCQLSKVYRHTKATLAPFAQPRRRFGHIHVDVVGPLPPSEGQRYLFTVVDRSTRWPEATPMVEANAETCAQALVSTWIARFGIPEHITSDRGSTFTAELWSALCRLLGVQLHHTTAYHPQANGMVERYHRSLKAALAARCTGYLWTQHLPWVLLGLRTTPKEGLTHSAAEMVYGEPLTVPGEFFPSTEDVNITQLRTTVRHFAPCRPSHPNARTPEYVPPQLKTSQYVFVRDDSSRLALSRPYRGPYLVLQRNDKAYKLDLCHRQDWVSVDRLKPAYTSADDHDARTVTRTGRIINPPARLDI